MSELREDRSWDAEPRVSRYPVLRAVTVGVGLLAALGLLLVVVLRLAPAYLDKHPAVGLLLVGVAGFLVLPVLDLWSPLRRVGMWLVGAAACLGVTAVYGASRAFGLPEGRDESWRDTWELTGLLLVVVYLLAMAGWFWATGAATRAASTSTSRHRHGPRLRSRLT